MDRLEPFIYSLFFLPSLVSLFWFIAFLLNRKSTRQRLFCIAELLSIAFYSLLAINALPEVEQGTIAKMELFSIPISLAFAGFMTAYIFMLTFRKRICAHISILLATPTIVETVAILILYYLTVNDTATLTSWMSTAGSAFLQQNAKVENLYTLITYKAFQYFGIAFIISISVLCMLGLKRNDSRTVTKKSLITREQAISAMSVVAAGLLGYILIKGTAFFSAHTSVLILPALLLSVLKTGIGFLEYYNDGDDNPTTIHELLRLRTYNPANDGKIPESKADEELKAENPPSKYDLRLQQFMQLMEEEKIWLNEDLDADIICKKMGISKPILTQIVNIQCGKPLREMINQYRIEESKAYMKEHPEAKLEVVAQNCGFKNSQYFITHFKKIEGRTPAIWKTTRL